MVETIGAPAAATAGAPEADRVVASIDSEHKPRHRTRKRYLRDGDTLAGVLSWTDARERSSARRAWRCGVMQRWGEHARVLRLAWALEGLLFGREGYAFAGNPYLARETGATVENLERALKALDDGGAIVRVHVGRQRRIYPGAAIIPATVTGLPTRHGERKSPVTVTGHNNKERHSITATMRSARLDAEIRSRKGRCQ